MATFTINNGDIISLTAKAEYQNQTIMNVLHYKANLSVPIVDGAAELNSLNNFFFNNIWNAAAGPKWRDLIVNTYRMDWFQSQVVYPTRQFYLRRLVGQTGNLAELGVPSNVGLAVNFQTVFATRGRSGSKHFTGIPVSVMEANRIEGGYVGDWQAFMTVLLTVRDVAGGGTFDPVVWSIAKPTTPSPVVLATVYDEIRIMRRRTFRIGI